jgi:hypothetical protein
MVPELEKKVHQELKKNAEKRGVDNVLRACTFGIAAYIRQKQLAGKSHRPGDGGHAHDPGRPDDSVSAGAGDSGGVQAEARTGPLPDTCDEAK